MEQSMLYDPVIPEGPSISLSLETANVSIKNWVPEINRLIQIQMLIHQMISNPNSSPFMMKSYVEMMLKQALHDEEKDLALLDYLSSLKALQQTYHRLKAHLIQTGCAILDLNQGHFFCQFHTPNIHLHWHLKSQKIEYWTYAHKATKRQLSSLPNL